MAARAEDRRAMREFFATPAGRDLTRRVQAATWRPSPPSATPFPAGTEAASADPLDPLRPFPAPPPVARRASYWPLIIVTIIATGTCAGLIGWFVSRALEYHR